MKFALKWYPVHLRKKRVIFTNLRQLILCQLFPKRHQAQKMRTVLLAHRSLLCSSTDVKIPCSVSKINQPHIYFQTFEQPSFSSIDLLHGVVYRGMDHPRNLSALKSCRACDQLFWSFPSNSGMDHVYSLCQYFSTMPRRKFIGWYICPIFPISFQPCH